MRRRTRIGLGTPEARQGPERKKRSHPKPLAATLVLWAALGLGASGAAAAPILYTVTSGSANVDVLVGGILVGQALNVGVTGNVTLDSAALTIDSVNLQLDPNVALSLSITYGGFDQVTIETASLTSDVGFGAVVPAVPVSASSFNTIVGALTVNGSWAGSHSSSGVAPVSNVPIVYPVPAMSAVVSSTPLINIQSVTLNALNGAAFGEAQDLVVRAEFIVFAIPEPGTALLLGVGLFALAVSGSRARTNP